MNKMRYNKPELLVICRSNPEEAVLVVCKVNNHTKDGPGNTNDDVYCCSVSGVICYDQVTS